VGTGVDGVLGVRLSAAVVGLIATPPTDSSSTTPATGGPTAQGGPVASPSPSPSQSPGPSAAPDPVLETSGSQVVVRSIAVTGPARPSLDAPFLPAHATGTLQLSVDGIGPGVRLVVAWLQPDGGSPTPFWIGWLEVAGSAP